MTDEKQTPLVEMRNIKVAFGGLHAIDDITIDLHAGEVVGLVGGNGAGKSTLMRVLSGARPADSGQILIDGKPAAETAAFLMSYVQPDKKNAAEGKGANPRDQSPHGVTLGSHVLPQNWTIVMTSDTGDYEITGSVTGADGKGNAFKQFTSNSGQIFIDPDEWRRAERNRTGDRFTFDVRRAVLDEISFKGEANERFVTRLAQVLPNREHTLELIPTQPGEVSIERLDVFKPPIRSSK